MRQFLLDKGLYTLLMEWVCVILRHRRAVLVTDYGHFTHCTRCYKAWH